MSEQQEEVGYIFFTQYVSSTPIAKVREAAKLADLPEKVVREIQPWNAFKRAMQQLTDRGVIARGSKGLLRDKVEDGETLAFQFTPKFLEGHGIRYDTAKAEVVAFKKATSKIACDDPKILSVAERLFHEALTVYHSGDIHRIAERLCAEFRRISLRDGVYFIPKGREKTLRQLENFYEAVNGSFWCRPVNHTEKDQKKLVRAIVEDLRANMDALRRELSDLRDKKKGANGITKKIAENRLKELQALYAQYRELATAIRTSIDNVFEEAGQAAATLMAATKDRSALIQSAIGGEKVDPTALELAAIANEYELPAGLVVFEKPVMVVEGEDNSAAISAAIVREQPVMPDAAK